LVRLSENRPRGALRPMKARAQGSGVGSEVPPTPSPCAPPPPFSLVPAAPLPLLLRGLVLLWVRTLMCSNVGPKSPPLPPPALPRLGDSRGWEWGQGWSGDGTSCHGGELVRWNRETQVKDPLKSLPPRNQEGRVLSCRGANQRGVVPLLATSIRVLCCISRYGTSGRQHSPWLNNSHRILWRVLSEV